MRSKVPASISVWARESYSSAEPSHQWMASGWVSSAISPTHCSSLVLVVRAGAVVKSLIRLSLFSRFEADEADVGVFVEDLQSRSCLLAIGEFHRAGEGLAFLDLFVGGAIDRRNLFI